MNQKFASIFVTAAVTLVVCTPLQAAQPKKAATTVQIDGQIFIVTKGQQAVKLPLVQVLALPEDDVNTFLTSKANVANSTRRELAPIVRELRQKQVELLKELQPALTKARELRSDIVEETSRCKALGGMAFVNCMKSPELAEMSRNANAFDSSITPLKERERQASSTYKDAKDRYDSPVKPSVFLAGLETTIRPLATVKTDADGKFTTAIPVAKRIALLATATRLTAGETEEYRWLLWVPINKGEKKVSVTLANDNLFETACSDCIAYLSLVDVHSLE